MKRVVSNYVYAIDGMELTENGKPCGVLVIAPEQKDLSVFGNVKEIKKVVEYTADDGKIFKNKEDGSKAFVINENDVDKFDEVDFEEEVEEELEEEVD